MKTRIRYAFGRAAWAKLVLICIAMLWAAIPASAATLPVTNCEDAGPGSLRNIVAAAASGDTVDLTQAGCDRIRLAGQPITISQIDLNIVGPGRYKLAIDGDYKSGVLRHMGTGVLRISGLSVEHGQHVVFDGDGDAYGGCIYSAGDVNIEWVEVRHCGAHARVDAGGGGIYAQGNVAATQGVVHSNRASGARPRGGGIAAGKNITLDHSRIANNKSVLGGGLSAGVYGRITVRYSTLANNVAQVAGAAEVFGKAEIVDSAIFGNSASYKDGAFQINELTLVNSTVSGNTAPFISAIETRNGLMMSNSTIAHNSAAQAADCDQGAVLVWVYTDDPLPPLPPHLDSSIFANNRCNGSPGVDLEVFTSDDGPTVVPITGANNLVMQATPSTGLPEDTISTDPKLEPLADNGGVRLIHALMADSPAIDTGNNAAGLTYDQRGPGYPRTKGAGTDIGAYER